VLNQALAAQLQQLLWLAKTGGITSRQYNPNKVINNHQSHLALGRLESEA
jgi:hypothetical protein